MFGCPVLPPRRGLRAHELGFKGDDGEVNKAAYPSGEGVT